MRRIAAVVLPGLLAVALLPSLVRCARLTGTFVDRGSRAPLAAVEVVARSLTDSTAIAHAPTGADGRFRLDGLRPDRYRLRASLLGYETWTRAEVVLTAAAPDLDLGTVPMTVAPIAVKGVTSSTARATAIVAVDRNIYLTKDMPAAGAGNTLELLRAVPELDVDVNDNVSLRGSTGVTIQINGRRSPLQGQALTNWLRQLPANRIERVEVIANPSAKFDPEGAGGIVNLVTTEALDLGWSGSVYATAGPNAAGGGPRLAWQRGKLTLAGGGMGSWGRYESRYEDERENLAARPPSSYRMSSSSTSHTAFGSGDGAFDFAFDRLSTLYGTVSAYGSHYTVGGHTGYALADSVGAVTTCYDRDSDGSGDWASTTATLGFRHVVHQNRDEWSLELRQSDSPGGSGYDVTQTFLVPADSAGERTRQDATSASRERSLQLDGIRPLGAKGKLEAGYRGLERHASATTAVEELAGSRAGVVAAYVHREVFHSGYVTAGSTMGRLSLQLGVRAEMANTEFDAVRLRTRYDHDYRSLYPSANAAWDFGRGRTARLTYSKRIERPPASSLDPDVPSLDPLNRSVGYPYLEPKYTHSYGLEASWTGSRGMLRLSPFYRHTVDNWDRFKTVDSLGVATLSWRNASSIRFLGVSLVASLRQVGRLGGMANLSLTQERHDASNFLSGARPVSTNWFGNGNVAFKAAKNADLRLTWRYSSTQTLAQGHVSPILWTYVGAQVRFLQDKAWVFVGCSDPFRLWKYTYVTADTTHRQTSTNRYSSRAVSVSCGWSWGKPPEQKARKQADTPAQPEQPQPQMH